MRWTQRQGVGSAANALLLFLSRVFFAVTPAAADARHYPVSAYFSSYVQRQWSAQSPCPAPPDFATNRGDRRGGEPASNDEVGREVMHKAMRLLYYWHGQFDALARLPATELVQLRWCPLFLQRFITYIVPVSFSTPFHYFFHTQAQQQLSTSTTTTTKTNPAKTHPPATASHKQSLPLTTTQRLDFVLSFARALLHRAIELRELFDRLQARASAGVLGGGPLSLADAHSLQGLLPPSQGDRRSEKSQQPQQQQQKNQNQWQARSNAVASMQKVALALVQSVILCSHEWFELFGPASTTDTTAGSHIR